MPCAEMPLAVNEQKVRLEGTGCDSIGALQGLIFKILKRKGGDRLPYRAGESGEEWSAVHPPLWGQVPEHFGSQSSADFHLNPHAATAQVADISLIESAEAWICG